MSNPVVSNPIELTVDGHKVVVPAGTLLVEASKQVGVEIPVFCHHEKLKPVGACRMCVVEIEKMPRLQTACTTPVAAGMVVRTQTAQVKEAREGVLEFLLANHPLDCPVCDKGGECPLQDNTFAHGGGSSRLAEPKRGNRKALPLSDRIVLDRERCILCYRCTRFHDEIAGDGALVPLVRGELSEIGTLDGESYDSPFAGNTVELCPVGALTSRPYRFRSRPWDLQVADGVCSGCSVGCNVRIDGRDGTVLRVQSRTNPEIDDGWLCDQGRYASLPLPLGASFVASEADRRVRWPMLRIDGSLQRVPRERAVARAMELLEASRSAVLLSTRLSNEALRLVATELRGALPNCSFGFTEPVVSPWPVVGRIKNLAACRRIVDLGCDPWHKLPVIALWLRKATAAGGTLVAVGPRNGLFRDSRHWLRVDAARLADEAEALATALEGGAASAAVTAAAADLRGGGPAAVLLGAQFATETRLVAAAKRIATALGAEGTTGFVGAPLRGANARGAESIAAEFASTDPLANRPEVVLSLGSDVPWLSPGGRAIVATAGRMPVAPEVEVVLPLAHPYETDGHFTNLEGVEQRLRGLPLRAADVRMDHELVRELLAVHRAAAGGGRV